MFDFILAGLLYLLIMFFTFSFVSFVTIGIAYTVAAGLKRFFQFVRQPDLALK